MGSGRTHFDSFGTTKVKLTASLSQVFLMRANVRPEAVCVIDDEGSRTYAQVWIDARRAATCLSLDFGISKGSPVMICSENSCDYLAMLLAVDLLGARCVLLTSGSPPSDVFRARALSDAQVIISTEEEAERLRGFGLPARYVIMNELLSAAKGSSESFTSSSFSSGLWARTSASAGELCVMTSGSTGQPKLVLNSTTSFMRNARELVGALTLSPQDVVYLPVPFTHVFGLVGIAACVASGACLVTNNHYKPAKAVAAIALNNASVHLGVSTMFVREGFLARCDGVDLSCLRAGLVAGAPCPIEVIEGWERDWGCRIMQSYGMSETAATLTVTPLSLPAYVRAQTAGYSIKGATLKIDEETGEVLCKSDSFMEGYICEAGQMSFPLDDQGWFHTGDLGKLDDQGRLSIVGRIKDIIIRGGLNIFPAEVERIFSEYPLVSECCVVGYPDVELGERTCLFVVTADGKPCDYNKMRAWGMNRIEKSKIPDRVECVREMPTVASGKVDKVTLRRLASDLVSAVAV